MDLEPDPSKGPRATRARFTKEQIIGILNETMFRDMAHARTAISFVPKDHNEEDPTQRAATRRPERSLRS